MRKHMCPRWEPFSGYRTPLAGARCMMGNSSSAFIEISLHAKMKGVGNGVCDRDVDNTPKDLEELKITFNVNVL